MTEDLLFLAGARAFSRIRKRGLAPSDVKVAVGASGAAKWLAIKGLDKAIYGQWFGERSTPLHLFGTSIGAWKFAAAAQRDPSAAFDRLSHAYIRQRYDGPPTVKAVSAESERILFALLEEDKAAEILSHPYLRFNLGAVKCLGWMASERRAELCLGLAGACAANFVRRRFLDRWFLRTLFYDRRDLPPFFDGTDFPTLRVPLSEENMREALLASGSIPLVMEGIDKIAGAPPGLYRDGGVLDYHPAFDFLPKGEGIVLYPHFYPKVTPGWFDKKLAGRRACGEDLSDVLILAPSPSFVAKLPYGRIPDRQDFVRMAGDFEARVRFWQTAADESARLGDAFMEAVETGRIRDKVRRIS